PFWAIESFGPSLVRLNVTRTVVTDVYRHMPAVTPKLTEEGRLAGSGSVQSGNTGKIVPLDAAALRVVREQIHIGTAVLDADDEEIGTIQAYDDESGYMRIQKDGLKPAQVFLPVTSVSFLDDEGIHLSDSRSTIVARYAGIPDVARSF